MELHIVRATNGQITLLAPLFDAYRQFYGQRSDVDGAQKFLSERLERGQSVILLAQKNGDACGFTQLFPAFSSVAMRPTWILNDLFVTPEARRLGVGKNLLVEILSVASQFRRQGVGSRLMAMAEAEAARRGCKYAYVDTMEYQAPSFYQALGYQVAGRLDDWDSHGHAKYFLKKTLRP